MVANRTRLCCDIDGSLREIPTEVYRRWTIANNSGRGCGTALQTGFELYPSTRQAKPRSYGAAMSKQTHELIHCKPGFSKSTLEESFGQFFMVGNGETPMRCVGVP